MHSKFFLITRKENGKAVKYAHVGTGNFNESTASIYSDISLLTRDKRITEEVEKLFGFYKNNYKTGSYKHLIVAPWDMRKRYLALINKEIHNAKEGNEAFIYLKLNSIVDEELIRKLYAASKAGVKIKMRVRGICSLVPGIKGVSENIEVRSIVDKYLEHSRIMVFCNGGDMRFYLSSADIMSRNLDHRSEVAVPVFDIEAQKMLLRYMELQFADNVKSRIIEQNMRNRYFTAGSTKQVRSQLEFYKVLKSLNK